MATAKAQVEDFETAGIGAIEPTMETMGVYISIICYFRLPVMLRKVIDNTTRVSNMSSR